MLEAYGQTDVGRRRKLNEDNFLVDKDVNLYAVCDGMGGHNAGEVASKMAIETLESFIRKSAGEEKDITWPYGLEAGLSFEANRLKTAIKLANKKVFKAADNREDYTGMGTTLVAALVSGKTGDPRLGGGQPVLPRARRPAQPAHARRLLGLRRLGGRHPEPRRDRPPPAAQRHHQGGGREGRDRHRPRRAPARRTGTCSSCARTAFTPCSSTRRSMPLVEPFPPSLEEAAANLIAAANEAGGKDNVSVVLLRYTE